MTHQNVNFNMKTLKNLHAIFCIPAIIVHEFSHFVLIVLFSPFLHKIHWDETFWSWGDNKGEIDITCGFVISNENNFLMSIIAIAPYISLVSLFIFVPQFWYYYIFAIKYFFPSMGDLRLFLSQFRKESA